MNTPFKATIITQVGFYDDTGRFFCMAGVDETPYEEILEDSFGNRRYVAFARIHAQNTVKFNEIELSEEQAMILADFLDAVYRDYYRRETRSLNESLYGYGRSTR